MTPRSPGFPQVSPSQKAPLRTAHAPRRYAKLRSFAVTVVMLPCMSKTFLRFPGKFPSIVI